MFEDAAAVTTILGWVNVIRHHVPKSWVMVLPFYAILLGILYVILYRPGCRGKIDLECVVGGVLLGLSASGAYSGVKNAIKR